MPRLTEYVIIVALVAIAAIGVVSLFGDNIRALFDQSEEALREAGTPSRAERLENRPLPLTLKYFRDDRTDPPLCYAFVEVRHYGLARLGLTTVPCASVGHLLEDR
ncbi:hypothetical protein AMJ57_03055 [Parcubacteria bacterium SG8_24]|nr:MAG: hypothetical protein AMJ57_03055 [Parcubacteria bacterium SG8_24]